MNRCLFGNYSQKYLSLHDNLEMSKMTNKDVFINTLVYCGRNLEIIRPKIKKGWKYAEREGLKI